MNRPVANVSWFAARAYARWIGRRLPTLQELEFVAAASNLISVHDTAGRVVHQQKGIGVPPAQTVEVIAGTH